MGSNTEKKLWTNLQSKQIQKLSKEVKRDNFYYRLVAKVGEIEKSDSFDRAAPKIISHFGCTNNIFL